MSAGAVEKIFQKITDRACKVTWWGYIRSVDKEGEKSRTETKKQGVTTMTTAKFTTKFSDADMEYWARKKQAEERFLKMAHEFQDELKKLADNEFNALWEKYRRYHPNKAYWRALTWEHFRRRDEKAAVELAAYAESMKAAPVGNGKPVIIREELRRMWRDEYAHEAGAADCRAGEDYKTFGQFCKEWAANFDIR